MASSALNHRSGPLADFVVDVFSGTGAQTAFTLSQAPVSENNTIVLISGVAQHKSTYSLSSTTLTFSEAPPSGTNNIEVISVVPLAIGAPSAGTVGQTKLDNTLLSAWPSGLNTQVGLVIKSDNTNPNYQIRIDCTEIVLKDSADLPRKFSSWSNALADLTASGAGGLDTGSEASSTWYYVWLIAKEDGTKSQMLSTSATSPTMPSGYTYKALVGAVRNNSSSHIVRFYQIGRHVSYDWRAGVTWTITAGGTNTSWTDGSTALQTAVPPIAEKWFTLSVATTGSLVMRADSGGSTPASDYTYVMGPAALAIGGQPIPNTQTLYWAVTAGNVYLTVMAYDL